jgi:protein-S-isoprenylcysteine O-methyltransferase Ste14
LGSQLALTALLLQARRSSAVKSRIAVPNILGALTIVILIAMVVTRSIILKGQGIVATKFGAIDKTDFVIPPFALFYFYLIFAGAFGWPTLAYSRLFHSLSAAWFGVGLCAGAIALMLSALVSFGASFRIGIDAEHPGHLVTSGIFAFTRNPIYVAFAAALLGEFLILPNWIVLLYLVAGIALFHRQVLREEVYLASHYGEAYGAYSRRVRRYL